MNLILDDNKLLGDSYLVREALHRQMRHLKDLIREMKAKKMIQGIELMEYEYRETKKLWREVVILRGEEGKFIID